LSLQMYSILNKICHLLSLYCIANIIFKVI
jgi:hypothetical protein